MYDSLYIVRNSSIFLMVLSSFWDRISQTRQAQNRGVQLVKSCDRHHLFPSLHVTNALERGHFGSLCSLALFVSLPVGVCEFRKASIRRRWCHCAAPEGSRCPARHESLSSESLKSSLKRVIWQGALKREYFFFFFTKHSVWDFWAFVVTALHTFFAWPFYIVMQPNQNKIQTELDWISHEYCSTLSMSLFFYTILF